MRDIESLIRDYCTHKLPPDPIWLSILNRRFPRLAARLGSATTVQREIEDHLRDSYDANLTNGLDPENAWQLARDRFGDFALLSQEILKARTQSYACLATRFLAVVALVFLPLGKNARFEPAQFLHLPSFGFMVVCAAVGYVITRRRDWGSLRKYALFGAWIGLLWGISRVLTVKDVPSEIGAPIAMVLLSTFYGLFFASPAARSPMAALMMVLCQFGVLVSLTRVGILSLRPGHVDAAFLETVVAFSIVSVLVGLIFFDVRKLHMRLAGVAAFGMVFAYIRILSNLTRPHATIFDFVCASTIPPIFAILIIFPIHRLQEHLLQKAH